MSAADLHNQIRELESERMLASLEGLNTDAAYMTDLTDEIGFTRNAYVGVAVTEIATLRAELSGPQLG
jgi:hypothetical protein